MLATIIAISAIVRGMFEIYAAIALRNEIDDEWILGLSGFMSVIFGGLIMFRPGAGLMAITLLIGAYMMAMGIFAVALSLRLRMMGAVAGTHGACESRSGGHRPPMIRDRGRQCPAYRTSSARGARAAAAGSTPLIHGPASFWYSRG